MGKVSQKTTKRRRREYTPWKDSEVAEFLEAIPKYTINGHVQWKKLAAALKHLNRSPVLLNDKYIKLRESGLLKESANFEKRPRRWTLAEEELFVSFLEVYGKNWQKIAKHMIGRTAHVLKSKYSNMLRMCRNGNSTRKDRAAQYFQRILKESSTTVSSKLSSSSFSEAAEFNEIQRSEEQASMPPSPPAPSYTAPAFSPDNMFIPPIPRLRAYADPPKVAVSNYSVPESNMQIYSNSMSLGKHFMPPPFNNEFVHDNMMYGFSVSSPSLNDRDQWNQGGMHNLAIHSPMEPVDEFLWNQYQDSYSQ